MPQKTEFVITKQQLLSRKIASRLISTLPRENIIGERRYSEKAIESRIDELTDQLSEVVQNIIDNHHEELIELISRSLIINNLFEVRYSSGKVKGELMKEGRLVSFLNGKLAEWKSSN